MDSEVLLIYRLIPRKPDFLGWLAFFDTTPIGRLWGSFFWRSWPHATLKDFFLGVIR
jgi:hypothetical protein